MLASATCTGLGFAIDDVPELVRACGVAAMDIVERMTASQPAQLGWKPESPMEWGQRICSGVSSHIAEMGQQYQQLKSDLRYPSTYELLKGGMADTSISPLVCCLHLSSSAVSSEARILVFKTPLHHQKSLLFSGMTGNQHAYSNTIPG